MSSSSHESERAAAAPETAAALASRLLAMADRDLAFTISLVGESRHALVQHFHALIDEGLRRRGITYGDHPLLRPMVEIHARELADFVQNGVALKHQFGLRAIEQPGHALALIRMDLWDSLLAQVTDAERHVLCHPRGLNAILAAVESFRVDRDGEAPP